MSNHKIIFTGPVGVGKTTAISSISDSAVVKTDEHASDMTQDHKQETTVAMDYGVMVLGDNERIHLYGTPGQERFNFMWDILTQGGIGLVLLLDNTRADPFKDMDFFLDAFKIFIAKNKVAIGITKTDLSPYPTLEKYHEKMKAHGINPPLFEVDAREKEDISKLVEALLFSLDPWLGE